MDHLCYFCPVFVMLLRLFTAALWAPAGKALIYWLSFFDIKLCFCYFPMWCPWSGVVLDCIDS